MPQRTADQDTSLKARIERNPWFFLAGALVAGFTAGFGAYQIILEVAQLEIISRSKLEKLTEETARASIELESATTAYAQSVRITAPRDGEAVPWAFDVSGNVGELPDDRHHLWLLTTDASGPKTRYWPQERIVPRADKTWTGRVYGIGGEPGKRRTFGIFVVGPDGQALLELWKAANIPHLALSALTGDTHRGSEVEVVVKSGRPNTGANRSQGSLEYGNG